MRKARYGQVFALFVSTILLVACGGKRAKEGYVELHLEGLSEASPLYLYSYTSQSIQVDTLSVSDDGVVDFSKEMNLDTVDILLLKNSKDRLVLPLLPDRESEGLGAYLKNGKPLELDGVMVADTIAKWYALAKGDLSALLTFIQAQSLEPLPTLFAMEALERDDADDCREELMDAMDRGDYKMYEWNRLLGLSLFRERGTRQIGVTALPSFINVYGEEEAKNLTKLMDKQPLMALNLFRVTATDTLLMKEQKRYLHLLDSLSIPSYNLLLNDSLPEGFSTKKGGTWRYFLLDRKGEVQRFIQSRRLTSLPTFQLVDSTLTVWRTWSDADSLVQFIEAYNAAKKREQ